MRGVTANVADGGTITHGMKTNRSAAVAPTIVIANGSVASQTVTVTAISTTTFTVAIKTLAAAPGTAQTIYWEAFIS